MSFLDYLKDEFSSISSKFSFGQSLSGKQKEDEKKLKVGPNSNGFIGPGKPPTKLSLETGKLFSESIDTAQGSTITGGQPSITGSGSVVQNYMAEQEKRKEEEYKAKRMAAFDTIEKDEELSPDQKELSKIKFLYQGGRITNEELKKKGISPSALTPSFLSAGGIDTKKLSEEQKIELARQDKEEFLTNYFGQADKSYVKSLSSITGKTEKELREESFGSGFLKSSDPTLGIYTKLISYLDTDEQRIAKQVVDDNTEANLAGRVSGALVGGLAPYAGMAKVVRGIAISVPTLNAFQKSMPFLFGATVENLGQEVIEAGIRKSTGQEYGFGDFFLGLGFGAVGEGIFKGAKVAGKMLKGESKEIEVFKNLDKEDKLLIEQKLSEQKKTNPYATAEEKFAVIKDIPVLNSRGHQSTIRELFEEASTIFGGERRLVGLKSLPEEKANRIRKIAEEIEGDDEIKSFFKKIDNSNIGTIEQKEAIIAGRKVELDSNELKNLKNELKELRQVYNERVSMIDPDRGDIESLGTVIRQARRYNWEDVSTTTNVNTVKSKAKRKFERNMEMMGETFGAGKSADEQITGDEAFNELSNIYDSYIKSKSSLKSRITEIESGIPTKEKNSTIKKYKDTLKSLEKEMILKNKSKEAKTISKKVKDIDKKVKEEPINEGAKEDTISSTDDINEIIANTLEHNKFATGKGVKRTFKVEKFGDMTIEQLQKVQEIAKSGGVLDSKRLTFENMHEWAESIGEKFQDILYRYSRNNLSAGEVMLLSNNIKTLSNRIREIDKIIFDNPEMSVIHGLESIRLNTLLNDAIIKLKLAETENGRAIVVFRNIARDISDPEYWYKKAVKEIGEKNIDTGEFGNIKKKSELRGEIKNKSQEIIKLNKDIKKLDKLEDETEALRSQFKQAQKISENAKYEVERYKEEIDKKNSESKTAIKKMNELNEELNKANEKLEQSKSELENNYSKIQEIEKIKQEIAKQKAEIQATKEWGKSAEKQLKGLEGKLETAKRKSEEAKKKLDDAVANFADQKEVLTKERKRRSELEKNITRLKKELMAESDGKIDFELIRDEIKGFIDAGDDAGLAVYIANLRPMSKLDKTLTYWKASILSGIKTQLINVGGNTINRIFDDVTDIIAATLNDTISLISKKPNAKKASDVLAGVYNSYTWGTIKKGLGEAGQILEKGATKEALINYEFYKEINGPLGILPKIVFRTMAAGDKIFFRSAFEKSVVINGRILAREKGISLEEAIQNVDVQSQAYLDGLEATFQDDNVVSGLISMAKRRAKESPTMKGQIAYTISELIIPFNKTLMNIAAKFWQNSPGGAFGTIVKAGIGKLSMEEAVTQITKQSVGMGMMFAGYHMYQKGLLNLGYQEDITNNKELTGEMPISINLGGKSYKANMGGPFTMSMVMGGYIAKLIEDGQNPLEILLASLGLFGRTMIDQAGLTGFTTALTVFTSPFVSIGDTSARMLNNIAGGFVPTFLSELNKGIFDESVREKNILVIDSILAKLPAFSHLLEPKRNAFGDVLNYNGGYFNQINPMTFNNLKDIPLFNELQSLGINIDFLNKLNGAKLSDDEKDLYSSKMQMVKDQLSKFIKDKEYVDAGSMVDKEFLLRGELNDWKKEVYKIIKAKMVFRLKGQDLKEFVLKDMKQNNDPKVGALYDKYIKWGRLKGKGNKEEADKIIMLLTDKETNIFTNIHERLNPN